MTRSEWRRSDSMCRSIAPCRSPWPVSWRPIAGVLNVWWNGQIDPNTISISETIHLLIIAVIGGIGVLEGAWLGALVYVAANNYLRDLPFADKVGLTPARFNTVVGLVVLAIVVLSPDGLMGLVERARTGDQETRRHQPAGRASRRTQCRQRCPTHRDRISTVARKTGDSSLQQERGRTDRMSKNQKCRKRMRLCGALISLALVGVACGSDDKASPAATDAPAPATDAAPAATSAPAATDAPVATDAPDGTSAPATGDGVKLGIMAECEGAFGGFNEDVQAGAALAMINGAGAKSNSRTTATRGIHRRHCWWSADRRRRCRMRQRHVRSCHPGDPQARRAGRRRRLFSDRCPATRASPSPTMPRTTPR